MLIVQNSPYSRPFVVRRGYPRRYSFYGLGAAPIGVPAIPNTCPSCPAGVSCAPCNPFKCPPLTSVGGPSCTGSWTQTYDPATKQTMCFLPPGCVQTPDPIPDIQIQAVPLPIWTLPMDLAKSHPVAVAVTFAVALFATGAAVAYHKR